MKNCMVSVSFINLLFVQYESCSEDFVHNRLQEIQQLVILMSRIEKECECELSTSYTNIHSSILVDAVTTVKYCTLQINTGTIFMCGILKHRVYTVCTVQQEDHCRRCAGGFVCAFKSVCFDLPRLKLYIFLL